MSFDFTKLLENDLTLSVLRKGAYYAGYYSVKGADTTESEVDDVIVEGYAAGVAAAEAEEATVKE